MVMVSNFGVEACPEDVAVIDNALRSFRKTRHWLDVKGDFLQAEEVVQNGLAFWLDNGRLMPTVSGLVVSAFWPVASPLFTFYFKRLSDLGGSKGRAVMTEIVFPKYHQKWCVDLLFQFASRFGWYGRSIILFSHKIEVTAPTWIRYCRKFDTFEKVFANLSPSLFFPQNFNGDLNEDICRDHNDIRVWESFVFSSEIQSELRVRCCLDEVEPFWLSQIAGEYITEGDLAFKGGAFFAALVLYGAAAEALLAILFFRDQLPDKLPNRINPEVIKDYFNASALYEHPELNEFFDTETVFRLSLLRRLRNTIHANKYCRSKALVGPLDALDSRRLLRLLINRIDDVISI